MWRFDLRTGAVLAANDAAAREYGYTSDELRACHMRDLWPYDIDTGGSWTSACVRADGELWTGTFRQRRRDGSLFDADVAMLEAGDAAGLPAMTVVVSPTSHSPVPEEWPMPDSTVKAKTLLGSAAAAVASTGPPGRELEDAGSDFVAVDAEALTLRACERVRFRADDKSVDVVVLCVSQTVWAQPDALADALYELIDNAVHATRRGHPVVVDVRGTPDGDVLWQVQDVGDGMSDEVLASLGKPPANGRSPGFGVALAWAIIERHGGLIRFESALRVGTTASVWLPGPRRAPTANGA